MKKILILVLLFVSAKCFSQVENNFMQKNTFWDSVYFKVVPYNSGAGIVHLGLDTVASSPTFGKLVRKTAGGSVALSSITAAVGSNDIDNGTGLQEWRWNALAGNSGLKLSSTSTAAASNLQRMLEIALTGTNATSTQTTTGIEVSNTHD